jgi:hypothetical protein
MTAMPERSHSPIPLYSGLTKTVAAPESRRMIPRGFGLRPALCRFFTGRRATQSGRGLPQSTTLTRNSFARNRLGGHRIFETTLNRFPEKRRPSLDAFAILP